jgi:UDP-N-acetylmuramate dehydrogenase
VTAGAAALDKKVADAAATGGVAGLEFFSGVPGTIGGALRMNAGCYGRETKDALISAVALDRTGEHIVVSRDDLGYAYRHSNAPDEWIFVSATFGGSRDAPGAIRARMVDIAQKREASQPIREKTGGSTFANPDPPGTENQRRAWALIEQAGCRGLQIGGARMSDKHANFMINTGDATAADLEALGEEVRRRVRESSGVSLRWEIKRIGVQ